MSRMSSLTSMSSSGGGANDSSLSEKTIIGGAGDSVNDEAKYTTIEVRHVKRSKHIVEVAAYHRRTDGGQAEIWPLWEVAFCTKELVAVSSKLAEDAQMFARTLAWREVTFVLSNCSTPVSVRCEGKQATAVLEWAKRIIADNVIA